MSIEQNIVYFSELKKTHNFILQLTEMKIEKKKLSETPTRCSFHHTDSFSAYKQIKEQPFLVHETKTIPPVNKWRILEIKCQFYLIQIVIRRYNLYVYKAQSSLN